MEELLAPPLLVNPAQFRPALRDIELQQTSCETDVPEKHKEQRRLLDNSNYRTTNQGEDPRKALLALGTNLHEDHPEEPQTLLHNPIT